MNRLKVLHVIGGGEFGGAERHILNLATALDPEAVEMAVLCLFAEPFAGSARRSGLNAFVLPMRHKLDLNIVGKIRETISSFGADIVHTHGVRANLLGRLAASRVHRPVVTTVHSFLALDYPGFLSRMANSLTERVTRGMTRHFIAVSNELRQVLLQQGIPPGRVTTIYNGVDLNRFHPAFEDESSMPQDRLVAIIARLHAVKGHRVFLQAAHLILEKAPDVRFLVVGSGPDEADLVKMTHELGIDQAVSFTGFVEDVPALLGRLQVLVVASRWEGFGLTAAEALAMGVPVVATAVGGLPEVVRPFETGLLVPYGNARSMADAITWMLEHPLEARQMAARGAQVVQEEFSARQMAMRTEEVYRKVVNPVPRQGEGSGSPAPR